MSAAIFLITLFVLSLILSYLYIGYAHRRELLDIPNSRSAHSEVTPRGGGLVFIGLWLLACSAAMPFHFWTANAALVFFPGLLLTALIGFRDDHQHVPARWRALVHFAAAMMSVYAIGGFKVIDFGSFSLNLGVMGDILAVLVTVWSINLFNFMDGSDGLAGSQAIIVLCCGGSMLWWAGGHDLALAAFAVAACVAGFLCWNWPPAKLFMGDVGSASLGFLVIVFAMAGEKWYGVPGLLWSIPYGVFIFDATLTLIRRVAANERWYEPHRLHAFQRLYEIGWSHKRILLAYVAVNLLLAGFALIAYFNRELLVWMILLTVLLLALLYLIIERHSPMYSKNNMEKEPSQV